VIVSDAVAPADVFGRRLNGPPVTLGFSTHQQ